ncbi:MAG: dihydrofolate reductase [Myxococcota bacterium]
MTKGQSSDAGLALIVAVSRNGVIGKDGTLPWRFPEDLRHFKRTTLGHAVIMGRKTFESIGRPLPSRRNIVLSRDASAAFEGCETATSLDEAIALARETDDLPFVIGGASLYEEALPLATEIYLTRIDQDIEGDTFFPTNLPDFTETDTHQATTPLLSFHRLTRGHSAPPKPP